MATGEVQAVSIEDGGARRPLQFVYEPATDILTIEGVRYSGDVFRTWSVPPNRFFKFERRLDGNLWLEEVVPCAECAAKFHFGDGAPAEEPVAE